MITPTDFFVYCIGTGLLMFLFGIMVSYLSEAYRIIKEANSYSRDEDEDEDEDENKDE